MTLTEHLNCKKIKKFIDEHRNEGISAADIEYSSHVYPEIMEIARDFTRHIENGDDMDKSLAKEIEKCNEPAKLIDYMRKPMNLSVKELLRRKILSDEVNTLPLIKEKCIKNVFDIFIENAVNIFIRCDDDCSDWIIDNYNLFRSEYLKSMLCLVLGFKGRVDLIPFLMSETARFEKEFPNDSFDRGPVLAVGELYYQIKTKID